MGEGARFAYQHDVRRCPNGTVTMFDNRDKGMNEQSRGITLKLDEDAMTAVLLREYTHPKAVRDLPGQRADIAGRQRLRRLGQRYLSEFGRDGVALRRPIPT